MPYLDRTKPSLGLLDLKVFQYNHRTQRLEPLKAKLMKKAIESLNTNIRKAAEEIGISHTILSRYIRKQSKRQNKGNDQKMLKWLKEHS